MNLLNMLEENKGKATTVSRAKEVSVLIGKVWMPEADKGFSIAPLTEPVEGKKGEYQISGVYPFIVTDYARISFGPNKKRDDAKNQNTHWAFLKIEESRLDEYKALCEKIGQSSVETK